MVAETIIVCVTVYSLFAAPMAALAEYISERHRALEIENNSKEGEI
jgi:hypothetical protein